MCQSRVCTPTCVQHRTSVQCEVSVLHRLGPRQRECDFPILKLAYYVLIVSIYYILMPASKLFASSLP